MYNSQFSKDLVGSQRQQLDETDSAFQRERLDRIVSEILCSVDNQDPTVSFIAWKLRAFRLEQMYEPHDILLDAYSRAVKVIEKGEKIYNFSSWLKSTAFNIIRENVRKREKMRVESLESLQFLNIPEPCTTDEALEMRVSLLLTELSNLAVADREILRLRAEGWSYEEIARQRGGTVTALRQRVSRLLKQLRRSMTFSEEHYYDNHVGFLQ